MKKTLEVQLESKKSGKKALRYFFRKHPELLYWKEQFDWMLKTGTDFFSDNTYADGTRNDNWIYALHLDTNEDHTYICIIEREEV